ncbi:UNVERIFIED_CONTAM: hypothetical protein HDU68_003429 [Siphonaria sp. JEL0065]|nr:hypothetical protein HDU68_003429 [Siphonaria sp. JEL0065]
MAPAAAAAYKPQSPTSTPTTNAEIPLTLSSTPTVETVENKIRAHIFAKRIRLVDLFADFDKLRSGYITTSQFRRCLGGAMERGVVSAPLTDAEYKVLTEHYKGQGVAGEGRIKWVAFVDSIDKVFGAKKLELTPTLYIPAPHEVVKPVRPPLTPKSESVLNDVIERLRQYVKHHGSDVKSWFTDFDKYNGGYITQNQFRRGIPPNVISLEEEELLLGQYSDSFTGTVNYFKMNTDVNRKDKKAKRRPLEHAKLVAKQQGEHVENDHVPVGTEELLHAVGLYWPENPSIKNVEDFIKKQVYKDRLRLIEFFKDYDRHNFGLVTEAQFRAGIRLTELNLDELEISTIVSAYKDNEGRVKYRQFCKSIEEIFTKSNLENDPLAEVIPPAREFLVQGTNELAPVEEARCAQILTRLKTLMKERRLLLAPFFKDFDKYLGAGNIGRVTRSHFSRLLSTMKMDVSDMDLHILFKKFEDREQAKVNYMEFIRTIDPETYHTYTATTNQPAAPSPSSGRRQNQANLHRTTLETLMDRIRYHAATKRIRVAEFFRDFDKLRCYSIPRHEFIRGINRIGLSLTPEEYEDLADWYADKAGKKGCCKWKEFEQDIEKVFNDTNLESQPTKIPEVASINRNPFLSADHLTDEERIMLKKTMKSLAEHWKTRRTSIKPFFKDFDKLCTGHVTKIQFRQCLTYLKVNVSDAEFEVLCKRWSKSAATKANEDESCGEPEEVVLHDPIKNGAERICYLMFLIDLNNELEGLLTDPGASGASDKEILRIGKLALSGAPDKYTIPTTAQEKPRKSRVILTGSEVSNLLTRIKLKAKTERIRVIDFMADFDNLKHGKITKNEFRRALKVVYVDLTEPELETLEALYQNNYDPGMVNYVQFSDAVESVFTFKGLINAPTMEPTPFTGGENGSIDPSLSALTESEQKILDGVVVRLCEKVRQRRIDVLSYLEDFDFVKEGTITTNQFRSVLGSINLPVDDPEITVLARRFTLDKNMDRINYRAFANMITGYAAERGGGIWLFLKGWRKPLALEDIYRIPDLLNTQDLSNDFFIEWNKNLANRLATDDRKNPEGKLLRLTLWNIFHKRILTIGLLLLLGNLCNLFAPYFVQYILEYAGNHYAFNLGVPGVTWASAGHGLGLVFGLLANQVLGAFLSNHFLQESSVEAIKARTMMTAVIYRKSLTLSSAARQEFTSGNVINLVSTDTARVEQFLNMANYIWVLPLALLINVIFLIISLGAPALAGIALLVLSGPLNTYLFSLIMKIRAVVAPIAGKRVNLTTEVLSGVRVIKFFAWETAFYEKVTAIRDSELALVLRRAILMSYVMTQGFSIPILCSCITFIIYGAMHTLDPASIFSSLSWFNQLRMPLFMLPMVLNNTAEFNVAMRRIEALLLASETESATVVNNESKFGVSIENGQFEWAGEVYAHGFEKPAPVAQMKGGRGGPHDAKRGPPVGTPAGTKTMNGGKNSDAGKPDSSNPAPLEGSSSDATVSVPESKVSSLKNINLNIEKGSLVAVVGSVGSGKSSLLNALIGEMKTTSGTITFSGSLGYAAQTAWIQNANLRDNVLFGKEYNHDRYLNALLDAALLPDLKVLPDGDQTSIGERGINLSGGQKQRVNLARLIYNDSDIVLIDDPLSAVDAHVGKHLFERCIRGALGNRTRILVTHQLHFLPQCDKIVVMKDGEISEQGPYQELIGNNGDFAKMIASYGSEDHGDAESTPEVDDETATNHEKEITELEQVLASKKTGKDIMSVEDQETGKVAAHVWLHYVQASGGLWGFTVPLLFILIIFQTARTGNDLWLTWWTNRNFDLTNTQYIVGYVVFGVIMTLGTLGYAMFFAFSGTRASRNLHDKALERILRAPTSFYDTTPLGRILNRFSRDVDAIDNQLSFSFRQLISQVAITLSTFIVMCSALPWFTGAVIPALVIYYFISTVYRNTARELKRLDSTSKSPLYANFGETLIGIATIRAYNDQHRFMVRNDEITDNNNSPYFLLMTAQNWLSLRLQLIGSLLVMCAALIGVLSDTISPSFFGLCLSYSLSVTQILSMTIQNFTQTEIAMNSVERIEAYAYSIPVEADAIVKDNRPPKEWPHNGTIDFKEVVMRYAPHLPIVLNNVSFQIRDKEKVGIVGRTGSGKSSLMQALFRMVEASSGSIVIDGVDIGGIGLSDLRSKIAIIPQDPVVFSGSFRSNMDPFSEYTDNELWDALSRAGLKGKVSKSEGQLDGQVDSGGENLSVGERQLLCLSRAMLKTPKILIMDEATANVDYETDAMIQKALREDFKDATVLTIAHRLNTVIDYDRVMVLEKGNLAEFDSPKNLLADETTMFAALVAQTGESNAAMLKEMVI